MNNSKINDLVLQRASFMAVVRRFFVEHGYLEVDTPIVVPCPGTEVYLRYFATEWTDHAGHDKPLFLRSSPELHMKCLLAAGLNQIFQIGPCFRNGGELSQWHNPEFTMLEWYKTQADLEDLMQQTEDLLLFTLNHWKFSSERLAKRLSARKIQRVAVYDVFRDMMGFDLIDLDPDIAHKAMQSGVISVRAQDDFDTAFAKCLIERIEPELDRHAATFLYDYPPSQAALARIKSGRARRAELYLGRVELSNGFEELTGEQENRDRYASDQKKRVDVGLQAIPGDEGFFHAMNMLPKDAPIIGNALGFDRLLAVLSEKNDLDQARLFRGKVFGSVYGR